MKKKEKRIFFADKDVQVILGTLLRFGVLASMSVILLGAFAYLSDSYGIFVDYGHFDADKSGLSTVHAIFEGLWRFEGAAVIQFGILLLIFTPIFRVVFSVFSFLIEKDYLYVLIGLFVLTVILFSLSSKLAG